jgi:hypothetical protein
VEWKNEREVMLSPSGNIVHTDTKKKKSELRKKIVMVGSTIKNPAKRYTYVRCFQQLEKFQYFEVKTGEDNQRTQCNKKKQSELSFVCTQGRQCFCIS